MKKIVIETFGKIKEESIQQLCRKYINLCNHYIRTEVKVYKDPGQRKIMIDDLNSFQNTPRILLSEKGKSINSLDFSEYLKNNIENNQEIVFLIGNAFGIDHNFIKSSKTISLSPLTFSHELSLVVLLEQLYRALNINAGGKYNK